MEDNRQYRLACASWSMITEAGDYAADLLLRELGPVEALKIARRACKDSSQRWHSYLPVELLRRVGVDKWNQAFSKWQARLKVLDLLVLEKMLARGRFQLLTRRDSNWPVGFQNVENAPWALWAIGDTTVLNSLADKAVAMVGARAVSALGNDVATELAFRCASEGIVLVSGGAYGVDRLVHIACLKAGTPTVSLLAGGLDRPYPASNADLFKQITRNGVLLSQYPPGARPTRWRFLDRNRLIASLSAATIVIQAGVRSGALNTANHAIELGKQVGAVPGPVNQAEWTGSNRLIRQGATLITSAEDVLEMISPLGEVAESEYRVKTGYLDGLDALTARILDATPIKSHADVEAIARASGVALSEVAAVMGNLEMDGRVIQKAGKWKKTGV